MEWTTGMVEWKFLKVYYEFLHLNIPQLAYFHILSILYLITDQNNPIYACPRILEHIRLSLNGKHYKQCWMTYNFSTMWATDSSLVWLLQSCQSSRVEHMYLKVLSSHLRLIQFPQAWTKQNQQD